jgi:hypothetical protein
MAGYDDDIRLASPLQTIITTNTSTELNNNQLGMATINWGWLQMLIVGKGLVGWRTI